MNQKDKSICFSSHVFREIPNLISRTSCHGGGGQAGMGYDRRNSRFGRLDLLELPLEVRPSRRRSRGSARHLDSVKMPATTGVKPRSIQD